MEKKAYLTEISAGNIHLVEKSLDTFNGDYEAFFTNLREECFKDDLSKIYSTFLQNSTDFDFLKLLLKEINSLRHPDNLSDLIDFLILKDTHKISNVDFNDFIDIRVLCLKVISNYKDTRAIEPILYCLNNKKEHYKFRLAAAEALGKIGDKNAVESLIDIVSDENEKSVYVRESAAVALGMIGDMRAVDPFLSILEAKKSFLDKFTFLKERVIEALGKIDVSNNKRVLSVFKNALLDASPQVRLNAVESLMNTKSDDAPDLIRKMLYDEDEEVARNSVIALYNLLGDSVLDEILDDENMPYYCKEEARSIRDMDEDEE